MRGGLAQPYREYGKRGRRSSAPALPRPGGLWPKSPARRSVEQGPRVRGCDRAGTQESCAGRFVGLVAYIRDMGFLVLRATTDFGHNDAWVSLC